MSRWSKARVAALVAADKIGEEAFITACEALDPTTVELCDFVTAVGLAQGWSEEQIFYQVGDFLLEESGQSVQWGHA